MLEEKTCVDQQNQPDQTIDTRFVLYNRAIVEILQSTYSVGGTGRLDIDFGELLVEGEAPVYSPIDEASDIV